MSEAVAASETQHLGDGFRRHRDPVCGALCFQPIACPLLNQKVDQLTPLGLVDSSRIVVIGATNTAHALDPALLSRFNLRVHFPLPDASERAAILGRYARHLGESALETLAAASDGRSGRELEDACGVAERLWASQLIREQSPEVSAPPLAVYLTAFGLKFRPR